MIIDVWPSCRDGLVLFGGGGVFWFVLFVFVCLFGWLVVFCSLFCCTPKRIRRNINIYEYYGFFFRTDTSNNGRRGSMNFRQGSNFPIILTSKKKKKKKKKEGGGGGEKTEGCGAGSFPSAEVYFSVGHGLLYNCKPF